MEEDLQFKIDQCNRNPLWIADFAYDGEFSDGEHFSLRIPEEDVIPFCEALLKAYADDYNGETKIQMPTFHIEGDRAVFTPGRVIKSNPAEQ